jgi:DNA-binding NarL/FixJ family response regulator
MTRILLADKHEVVRRGARGLLKAAHPEWRICGEAADGREAVDMSIRLKPDVVVIEPCMPELNGLGATRQIRRALPNTEVLLFAECESGQSVREIVAAGARGVVLKADPGQQLVAAVEALSRHQPYFTTSLLDQLMDLAIGGSSRQKERPQEQYDPLSPREREVVQLLAEGKSNKEVAACLFVSVRTVETHRATIMRKLELSSIVGLVHYAVRHQMVHLDGYRGVQSPSLSGGVAVEVENHRESSGRRGDSETGCDYALIGGRAAA